MAANENEKQKQFGEKNHLIISWGPPGSGKGHLLFDSYNEKIWTNLKVQRLSEHTFRYSLILPGKYIFVGNRNRTLHQTIKMLY